MSTNNFPRIQILSPLLANQIAAGEVIERPASVVKELIENSIDAGATLIDITIEQGGLGLIKIRDNGRGIHRDDLKLALKLHTTSKIREQKDLEEITTLGFRGEALASIASVSRFTLSSAEPNQTGWQVMVEGNKAPELQPIAHPEGTTAEVAQLFFNTPGRRKFMRSEKTEFDHIDEQIKRMALSAFSIDFTLTHNHRLIRQYFKTDMTKANSRLGALCGNTFLEQAIHIEAESAGMRLHGWIGLPTFSRGQADLQYFYVNNRIIRDKLVLHALKKAYHDVLYRDRHPAFVLFLEVNPQHVDVNVHPTKHEVRFREARIVHEFILHAIQNALAQVKPNHSHSLPAFSTHLHEERSFMSFKRMPSENCHPQQSFSENRHAEKSLSENCHPDNPIQIESLPLHPLGEALAQLHGIYILAENKEGLVLVDMHAAHERILYEKMKKEWLNKNILQQILLVPLTLAVSEREATVIDEHPDFFSHLGFHLERIGKENIVVRSVPQLLAEQAIADLIQDMISDLLTHGHSSRSEESIHHLLGTLACRASLRAHRPLTLVEMNNILREMEKTGSQWSMQSWTPYPGFFFHEGIR